MRIYRKNTFFVEERGVLINDLNAALAGDIERYISEDLIHLTPEGLEVCAQQTAALIREAAKTLTDTPTPAKATAEVDANGVPVLFE